MYLLFNVMSSFYLKNLSERLLLSQSGYKPSLLYIPVSAFISSLAVITDLTYPVLPDRISVNNKHPERGNKAHTPGDDYLRGILDGKDLSANSDMSVSGP